MNVVHYVSDLHACGTVRADVPARAINAVPGCRVTLHENPMLSEMFGTDVMVFQRGCQTSSLNRMRLAKERGIKTIYDIDDDMFSVPEHVKDAWAYFSRPETKKLMAEMLNMADAVTASTPKMAEVASRYTGSPIHIVPNCVDVGHADFCLTQELKRDDRVTIGWHGSMVHIGDVPVIEEALCRVLRDNDAAILKLWGHFEHPHFHDKLKEFGDRVTMMGWIDPNNLYYGLRQCDIGLAPLDNTPFNLCKSNVKWMEYACAEAACVATPLPPYDECRDGVDVLFARTGEEWYEKLTSLVRNPDLRKRIAYAARLQVGRRFDSRHVANEWKAVYRAVMGWRK